MLGKYRSEPIGRHKSAPNGPVEQAAENHDKPSEEFWAPAPDHCRETIPECVHDCPDSSLEDAKLARRLDRAGMICPLRSSEPSQTKQARHFRILETLFNSPQDLLCICDRHIGSEQPIRVSKAFQRRYQLIGAVYEVSNPEGQLHFDLIFCYDELDYLSVRGLVRAIHLHHPESLFGSSFPPATAKLNQDQLAEKYFVNRSAPHRFCCSRN